MFADPLSAAFSGASQSYPRIESGARSSRYRYQVDATDSYDLSISHTEGRRNRSVIRVDKKFLLDSFYQDGQSNLISGSLYLVCDRPPIGMDDSDVVDIYAGLNTLLTASTNANLLKWLSGQS
jgi:hypothetical protein